MYTTIIAISGPISAGKSTLASTIHRWTNARVVSTKEILMREYAVEPEIRRSVRPRLQELGESLDVETGGRWVAAAVGREIEQGARPRLVVVDAVRIPRQLTWLKTLPNTRVVHVNVWAPLFTLRRRYVRKASGGQEFKTYEEVRQNATEANIGEMRKAAAVPLSTFLVPRLIPASIVWLTIRTVQGVGYLATLRKWMIVLAMTFGILAMIPFALQWSAYGRVPLIGALFLTLGLVFTAIIAAALVDDLSPVETSSLMPGDGREPST